MRNCRLGASLKVPNFLCGFDSNRYAKARVIEKVRCRKVFSWVRRMFLDIAIAFIIIRLGILCLRKYACLF